MSGETTWGLTGFSTNLITVVWSAAANEIPVNTTEPVIHNADDSTFMYARYRFYIITTNCSDADTYSDIHFVLLLFWDNGRSVNYWTVAFAENTNTFSVVNGSANVAISATSSSYIKSGNWLNITWYIKIDWDHTSLTDIDTKSYVNDTAADSDTDWYESNWDVESRIEYTTLPTVDDNIGTIDRGSLDTAYYVSGVIIYYGSGDNYPLANETDVWVLITEYGATGGPWSGGVDGVGKFNITVYSDNVYGQDTVTIKVVEQGEGSGGTDLYWTTTVTDLYISDSLTVYISPPTDQRQDINANATGMDIWGVYDYGGAFDGSLTVNNTDYNGDGTVARWGYNISSASGGIHGVTSISSTNSTYHIWDQVIVLGYNTNSTDNHDNINDGVLINVWLQYDFDDTNVTDGTVLINSETYTYLSNGNFTAEFSNATASSATWNTVVITGNAHGIMGVNQNSKSQNFKWDSLIIGLTDPTDQRQNLNANATGIAQTAIYALGGSYDGTLELNNTDYNGDGTAVRWGYEVDTANGDDTYGITAISDNSDTTYMIWDSLTITADDPDDQRIDINVNMTAMGFTAVYDYDGNTYDGTLTLNDTTYDYGVVGIYYYTISSVSGDTYDITTISSNDNTYCIFDRIKITATSATDGRIDYGTSVTINVTAELEYDLHPLDASDTLYMNDTQMIWDTDHFYFVAGPYNIIDLINYYVNSSSASEATYGITVINLNGQDADVIWDRIEFLTSYVVDGRIDISTEGSTYWVVQYEYSSTNITSGLTAALNVSKSLTWNAEVDLD
jgi:hypothetical protein